MKPELIKDEGGVDLASLLLMVGDDAANEVGVGVAEGDHQLGKLLLVKLRHRPEHPLPRHSPKLSVRHCLLGHTHNLRCKNLGQAYFFKVYKLNNQLEQNVAVKQ